ncbi:MAG: hypothetical protein Q9220_005687 [cf. Caloplaca sp. 1 TL-2023]
MSSTSIPHKERTAGEWRQNNTYGVKLASIEQVNDSVRLIRLHPSRFDRVYFRPGQWLDVHIPGIQQAGGFTITSTPLDGLTTTRTPHDTRPFREVQGYLELAIQKSPKNPPAAWLWEPEEEILGSHILVRVGGNFKWPPPGIDRENIRRLVFVAGGVGINPLMSMISRLYQKLPEDVPPFTLLYATRYPISKDPSTVLFLDRLKQLFESGPEDRKFQLFLTQCSESEKDRFVQKLEPAAEKLAVTCGRISHQHLLDALGPIEQRKGVVAYVCGVPTMTDEFVDVLRAAEGMEEERVLCEKWW